MRNERRKGQEGAAPAARRICSLRSEHWPIEARGGQWHTAASEHLRPEACTRRAHRAALFLANHSRVVTPHRL